MGTTWPSSSLGSHGFAWPTRAYGSTMHGSRYGSMRVSTPLLSSRTNSVPTPLHSSCLSMTLTLPPDPSSSLSSLTVEHNARLAKILRKIEQIDAGDADAAVRHAAMLPLAEHEP